MIGHISDSMTSSLSRSTIMRFIRSVPNCAFAGRNLLMRRRLRKLYLQCSHLNGSSSSNTVLATTKSIPILFIFYFKLKSMMSYSLRMALSARLVLNLYLKFI